MSTIIRNENELATLRCGLRLESRRWFMATRPFLGAKVLGPELLTPVKEMGFVSGTPERGMLGGIPGRLPEGVLQQVEKLDAEAAPGAPLWLQVERDAQMAAVFP